MELVIEFNSKYKGMRKNALREKMSSFWLFIFGSIVALIVGVYLVFWCQNKIFLDIDPSTGYILCAVSIFLLIAAPFNLLFTNPNRKISGVMKFTFSKCEDSEEYNYKLETTKKRKPFYECAKINMLVPKKNYFILESRASKSYLIPYSEISSIQKEKLQAISEEIKELRIKETKENSAL